MGIIPLVSAICIVCEIDDGPSEPFVPPEFVVLVVFWSLFVVYDEESLNLLMSPHAVWPAVCRFVSVAAWCEVCVKFHVLVDQ